jgi:hypothetical protein
MNEGSTSGVVREFVIATSRKRGLVQLLEQFLAHAVEPGFFQDAEAWRGPDRLVEGQLPLAHTPDVFAEGVGGPLRLHPGRQVSCSKFLFRYRLFIDLAGRIDSIEFSRRRFFGGLRRLVAELVLKSGWESCFWLDCCWESCFDRMQMLWISFRYSAVAPGPGSPGTASREYRT